jgi:hypothetical protein
VTTHVDVEELQTTKSEKLLAVVMTAFLLLAGLWTYQEIDDRIRRALPLRNPTAAERVVLQRRLEAQTQVFRADNRVRRARGELELRREAYRTALDEERAAPELRAAYREAVATHEQATRERARARADLAAAQPAANEVSRRVAGDVERRRDLQERLIFLTRLGAAIVFVVASYVLLARLRNRGSRYLPLAAAGVGFATIFAFVLAGDYLTDYFDLFDFGILVLALLGISVTFVAFWVLQRYIARRLPRRRVRKRECPFCGYPVGANERCEGCGRAVMAPCANCERPRRVGTPFCAHCGQAA